MESLRVKYSLLRVNDIAGWHGSFCKFTQTFKIAGALYITLLTFVRSLIRSSVCKKLS